MGKHHQPNSYHERAQEEAQPSKYSRGTHGVERIPDSLRLRYPARGLRAYPVSTVISVWLPRDECLAINLELAKDFFSEPREKLRSSDNLSAGNGLNNSTDTFPTESRIVDFKSVHATVRVEKFVRLHGLA